MGDIHPIAHARNKRPVRLRLRVKPGGVLRGLAIRQGHRLPGGVLRVEGPPQIHRIHSQPIQDEILRLGQLLDDIVNAGLALGHPEVLFEIPIGDGRDAGTGRAAEVDRDPVGYSMLNGGQDSFARGHSQRKW